LEVDLDTDINCQGHRLFAAWKIAGEDDGETKEK